MRSATRNRSSVTDRPAGRHEQKKMPSDLTKKYQLVGEAGDVTDLTQDSFEGEVEAEWFSARIDRKKLKALMRRTDGPAIRQFGLWLIILIASGAGAVATWGTWWCVPFFAVYGVMYSVSDHHAHELSHGTPFRTRWLNDAFLQLNTFMTLHEPVYWRWSHTRHHTDTLMVGRDPEIAVMVPPDIAKLFLDIFFLKSGWTQITNIVRQAAGDIAGDGAHFISRRRESQGNPEFADLRLDIRGNHHRVFFLADRPAGPPDCDTTVLRWLRPALLQYHSACRSARGHPRPPAEHQDVPHKPYLQLPLHEHELSHRAPYVSHGAVSCPACPT
jgi:hypothetical protein